MKKFIVFLFISVMALPLSSGIYAQSKKKSATKAKTSVVKEQIGEPIQEILNQNDQITASLDEVDPSIVYQIIKTQAFLGPAAQVAASNPGYRLNGADKQALKNSFSKMLNAMKPGLVKNGNSQAQVNNLIEGIKTELNKSINQMTTLSGFYM